MAIDMSLDEVIRQNRTIVRRRGERGRGRGGFRRSEGGRTEHSRAPLPTRRVFTVTNDRFSPEATITVSNLFHEVTREDLQELFSQVGSVKHVRIHYDRAGRSNGAADVTFFNRRDAMVAADRFHHVPLDGHPMQIQVLAAPHPSEGRHVSRNEPPRHEGRGDTRRHESRRDEWRPSSSHGVRKSSDFRRREPGRAPRNPTADPTTLDADLDSYMMQQ